MANNLVCDALLLTQQLLQPDDGSQDQSDLADDQGLTSDESNGTESQRNQGSSLQFQGQKKGQKDLGSLLCKKEISNVRSGEKKVRLYA